MASRDIDSCVTVRVKLAAERRARSGHLNRPGKCSFKIQRQTKKPRTLRRETIGHAKESDIQALDGRKRRRKEKHCISFRIGADDAFSECIYFVRAGRK